MFKEEIQGFLDYLRVECGLSENTISAYRRDLLKFGDYLKRASGGDAGSVKREDIVKFVTTRLKAGASANSIARNCTALRMLFKYLFANGAVKTDIATFIESPKTWKKIPHTLMAEEIDSLLEWRPEKDRHVERNSALLELLYATGARASETVNLKLQDVNLALGYLRCFGKGNKERIVPLGKRAAVKIERYIVGERARLLAGTTSEYLFINAGGKRIGREMLWRIVSRYAREVGLGKSVYPHLFRHSFATHLVENGVDIRYVQEMLGHSSIATTQIYTHVDRGRLLAIHRKYHPRS